MPLHLKTAKFAIDNFIPIVGKSFSDAISSVAGYSLIIKNAIGSIGFIVYNLNNIISNHKDILIITNF